MSKLYSKDSTNPYGFSGLGGAFPGRHRVSRFDKQTPAERNRIEDILTEVRNELTTQIDDTTSIHEQITYKVFVPETRTNVVNASYNVFEFRGVGLYEPANSLDGPVYTHYEGFFSQVIVHRKTPGTDGSTVVDVKINGESVLPAPISIDSTDTSAVVFSDFTNTYFDSDATMTVDVVSAETAAEDLMVQVEIGYPFQSDIFTADFVQYGVPYVVDNLDGIWVCPFEAEWKFNRAMVDTTASGLYDVQIHAIDASTANLFTVYTVPGTGGQSIAPGNKVRPGDKFAVSLAAVPNTLDDMNFRAMMILDKRTLNYQSIMNFIGGGFYETATAWDVPRYIPETIVVNEIFLTRGIAGNDGSTVVVIKDDGTEIARASIDSSTTYFDSTTCQVAVNATVAAGSYLTFDILETDSPGGPGGAGPSDLRCQVVYEKSIPANPTTFADSTETAALRGEVSRLDSTAAEIATVTSNNDSTVANILSDLTAYDSTIANVLTDITRLDSTVAEIAVKTVSLDATVSEIRDEQTVNNVLISSIASNLASVDSTVATLAVDMERIDSTSAEVATKQTELDSTVAETVAAFSLLEDQFNTLNSEFGNVKITVLWDMTNDLLNSQTITSTDIHDDYDGMVFCDAEGGAFYIALKPVAIAFQNRVYHFKKIDDSTNVVTLDANGSELIEGSETYELSFPGQAVSLMCDGTTWHVESNYNPNAGTLTPQVTYADFDNAAPVPSHKPGRVFWDDDNQTLSMYSDSTQVTHQVGQEGWMRVKNDEAFTMVNGRAAAIVGVNGTGVPTVNYAVACDSTFQHCAGLLTMDIPPGEYGFITRNGLVNDIDTRHLTVGSEFYLSDSTAGWYDATTPIDPDCVVQSLGTCYLGSTVGKVNVHMHEPVKNSTRSYDRSWAFNSLQGSSGTYYAGGFYDHGASNNDFSPSITHGTANGSYAAHVFVVLGEPAVDEITIEVTGTRITDGGVRTPSYTATITVPSLTAADAYFETPEKFIGQVTIETTAGTAKNCNYGFCKYWDNNNRDFVIMGSECTWLAGANDANVNLEIIHHKTTGWTYNAGAEATPPAFISLQTDHNTEYDSHTGQSHAWKRANLDQLVKGSESEGIILIVTTTVNTAIQVGTFALNLFNKKES